MKNNTSNTQCRKLKVVVIGGTDRLSASGYFRAKLAQETLIKDCPIPCTIVRATQFFEFVSGIAHSATDGQTVRLPSALMQPIMSSDVAVVLAEVAVADPLNGTVDLAGPDLIPMDELVRKFLKSQGDSRTVITDESATYFGAPLEKHSFVPIEPSPLTGPTRFEDWLRRSLPAR